MKALPVAMAIGAIHSGTITGKLNGVIPATTPSGWRIEYTSMPLTAEPAAAGPDQTDETPVVCEGFQWIGQSFAICDRCGQPAWDHAGQDVAVEGAGPFDNRRTVRPWGPGEADAIRAKWGTPSADVPAVGGAQQPKET